MLSINPNLTFLSISDFYSFCLNEIKKAISGKTSKEGYWDELYQKEQIGWDIGYPSPALKDYIDQLTDKSIAILIPGCGNAYEAEYLLAQGFSNITLIDIAPTLTEQLTNKFRGTKGIRILTGDFFVHNDKYDLIVEQTFLSALDPSLRPAYVKKNHDLLQQGGHLTGILFSKHFEENPPYGGTIEEYRILFRDHFLIRTLEPCYNSIDRRQGSECFINLIAK